MLISLICLCSNSLFYLTINGESNKLNETGNSITRGEWIYELVELFEMNVSDDLLPDNYFPDLTPDHIYYHEIMVAVENGLIELETGKEFHPNEPATRDFAAHTLNFCLGFSYTESSYTFNDYDLSEYPNDIQIAINRGWIKLSDNNALPQQKLDMSEVELMKEDAKRVLSEAIIDAGYNNSFVYQENVIVVPSITEYNIENSIISFKNLSKTINKGDIFVVYSNGLPLAFVAENIDNRGTVTNIKTSEIDINSILVSVDAQGKLEPDLRDVIPAENTTITYIAGGSPESNYEDGEFYSSPRTGGTINFTAIKLDHDIIVSS